MDLEFWFSQKATTYFAMIVAVAAIFPPMFFAYFVKRPLALYDRLEQLPKKQRLDAIKVLNPHPNDGISGDE